MIVLEDSFKWSHRIGFRSCTQKLELIAHKEWSYFSHPERLASRTQSYPSCALQIIIKLLPSYSLFKLPQYFERSMLYQRFRDNTDLISPVSTFSSF